MKCIVTELHQSIDLPVSRVKEISQEENINATTRLWIQDDGTIFKEYVLYNEITKRNISNLLSLIRIDELYQIKGLTMPCEIFVENGTVRGYKMPFRDGALLSSFLLNEDREKSILQVFKQLAIIINSLPNDVFVGDLHCGNVVIEKETACFIDIDGFSLLNGAQISCPLDGFADYSILESKKYHHRNGSLRVSRDTDICCLILLFLRWIMKADPIFYTREVLLDYFKYLRCLGIPKRVVAMLSRILENRRNYLRPELFEMVPTNLIQFLGFSSFASHH